MVTDNDLFAAIADAVREVESGCISIGIAVRDIRVAVRKFDAQSPRSVASALGEALDLLSCPEIEEFARRARLRGFTATVRAARAAYEAAR